MVRRNVQLVCLALLFCALAHALPTQATRAEAECAELGFDKQVVNCAHCETLFTVTHSSELKQECLDCCSSVKADDGNAVEAAQYVSARIEGRGIFRAIEATGTNALAMFHSTYKEEPYFDHVSFHDKFSAVYPQVVLVDAEGKDAMAVRIAGWSPETLHEFLKKKIHAG